MMKYIYEAKCVADILALYATNLKPDLRDVDNNLRITLARQEGEHRRSKVAPALTGLWAGNLHGASSAGRNGEAKIVQLDDGGDDAQSEP